MKIVKKGLALLLCLLMMGAVLAFPVSAASTATESIAESGYTLECLECWPKPLFYFASDRGVETAYIETALIEPYTGEVVNISGEQAFGAGTSNTFAIDGMAGRDGWVYLVTAKSASGAILAQIAGIVGGIY